MFAIESAALTGLLDFFCPPHNLLFCDYAWQDQPVKSVRVPAVWVVRFTHEISLVRDEQARAGLDLGGTQARFAPHQEDIQQAANHKIAKRFVGVDNKITINGSTSIEGLGIRILNLPTGKGDPDKPNAEKDGSAGSRQLQSSCASGSSFTIASSVFPSMEGCYSASTDTSGGEVIYGGGTSLVLAFAESDDSDANVRKMKLHGTPPCLYSSQ